MKGYNGVDLGERRAAPRTEQGELWHGFGNGLSQAFEMAVVPALFALAGLAIDGFLGTSVVFTITLAVIGLVGVMARAYYWYQAEAGRAEEGKPWARRA
ncbi:MAG TPA: AtpZ/AtpI family protein [Acidimicrobiia bacterium]|nr:AtpZ/AtpI family protein [Acidimicrobiia bacterium]